jgi:hypothetical protein
MEKRNLQPRKKPRQAGLQSKIGSESTTASGRAQLLGAIALFGLQLIT